MMDPTPTLSNQTLIPCFPNDVSINVLARLSRAHHPSLSLVSKAFHSLLSSPLFFTARSLVNSTETSLFIILQLRKDPFTRQLFTLRNRRLIPLPPIPCRAVYSVYATLGPCIYVLGGCLDGNGGKASADVWIFDCRSNKWAAGPRMRVARQLPMVGVVDGKLYVIGGCKSGISAEIYDPDVGSWEAVETFLDKRIPEIVYGSAVIGRKIYATASSGVVGYDVGTRVWEYITDFGGTPSCCILDGVLYRCDFYQIKGFDLEKGKGRQKAITGTGLESNHRFGTGNMQVVNFDGKLVAVWQYCDHEVRCMEIDVKKGKKKGKLQGNVCFNDSVFSSPDYIDLTNCLAVAF